MIALVLATHNAHKVEELRRILGTRLDGIDLVAYDGPEPVEDGTTFEENALIKARAAALHTGHAALADDSGISVDILGGSPGIFSARWAGPARDSRENLELLLWQLADVPDEHRGARFTCAAALVVPTADGLVERTALGAWEGSVLREVAGRAASATTRSSAPPPAERAPRPSAPTRRTGSATARWRSTRSCPWSVTSSSARPDAFPRRC
ncbi:dITP/XTP pyrophosphatase [Clavibacter michiganensis subsp. michiganensis]|uniref:DITP/XTP pyrophosphatase n=1 Tax=Clavibacter michiganensis subsp. michiganensis TaxID=33013 RepID=A0A251XFZ9_CLAMM|nr:dITP/XTP pyrophosphatase [Clavibacter michiganensis subsp. michiganensis]OUE01385.1 dITP/XTP pyrophosphatase [Clavibacter michiganensis subsp. michiganensis]